MGSRFSRRSQESERQRSRNAPALPVIALGVVGVLLGTGATTTAIGMSDRLPWLADRRPGDAQRYVASDGVWKRPAQVARTGDEIPAGQDSDLVTLRNDRTGEAITVDPHRLQPAGAHLAGGPSKVLVAKGMMVLVDRDGGTLRRIDPVKGRDLGQVWRSAAPVADAVADQQGTVWVLSTDGRLRGLAWNDHAERFGESSETQIRRVADDGLLAAHPIGVTVFGPRAGVIAQVGTAHDGYRQSNQLVGIAPQATDGPADLVVGALPNRSSVVISDRGAVRQVSTAELGCDRPINPAAFDGRVYVVCQGDHKVIQLTREGRTAGAAIATPGSGDAEPVADGGRLVLNVGGAGKGIEIDRAGSEQGSGTTPQPAAPTQTSAAVPTPAAGGVEPGRDRQAPTDLAVTPLPGGPGSGSVPGGPGSGSTHGGASPAPSTSDSPAPNDEAAHPESGVETSAVPTPGSEPRDTATSAPTESAPPVGSSPATAPTGATKQQPNAAPSRRLPAEGASSGTKPTPRTTAARATTSTPTSLAPATRKPGTTNPARSTKPAVSTPAPATAGPPATQSMTATQSTTGTQSTPATRSTTAQPASLTNSADVAETAERGRPSRSAGAEAIDPLATSTEPDSSAERTDPPTSPTWLGVRREGTSATGRFDKVAPATDYPILCDAAGVGIRNGTPGPVACEPGSAGKVV